MSTKLNQIIAVEKGIKSQTSRVVTDSHHLLQKGSMSSGLSRTYQPRHDDGDCFPSETTKVQVKVKDEVDKVSKAWSELLDITMTKDTGNCQARADVVVDGQTILSEVPVTSLLFLEKQLTDLRTFVQKLPTLDPQDEWKLDIANSMYRTDPVRTFKTKKVIRNHVKAEATEKHPAQVETYSEDVVIGEWQTTKMSGALPASEIAEMLSRVEKLQRAVKFAREAANSTEVTHVKTGHKVYDFVFGR